MFFFFIQVFFPFLLLYCTVIVLRVCVCGRVWKCDENLFGLIYVIISSMNYVHYKFKVCVFSSLNVYLYFKWISISLQNSRNIVNLWFRLPAQLHSYNVCTMYIYTDHNIMMCSISLHT